MPLLQAEPPNPVRSLDELFAIALVLEEEAAARYAELAERMRSDGNADLAVVFDELAAEERRHVDSVVRWSGQARGAPPDRSRLPWAPPQTFDDEGATIADARLQSAYRSLSMAVRNEERAFAFWTYVAAQAESDEIRQAAERMAHEELGHVATLRRERRRAFHAERRSAGPADPAALESRMALLLDGAAGRRDGGEAESLRRLAAEAAVTARNLAADPLPVAARLPNDGMMQDHLLLAEALVEIYLDAADQLTGEAERSRAQSLAAAAIGRLARLGGARVLRRGRSYDAQFP